MHFIIHEIFIIETRYKLFFQVNIFSEVLNKFYHKVFTFWSEPPGKPRYSFINGHLDSFQIFTVIDEYFLDIVHSFCIAVMTDYCRRNGLKQHDVWEARSPKLLLLGWVPGVGQDCIHSGGSRGRVTSLPFPQAAHIPWLLYPSIFKETMAGWILLMMHQSDTDSPVPFFCLYNPSDYIVST